MYESLVDDVCRGETQIWHFENFSGDWEQVSYDRCRNAFLFGASYDFDYRYIQIT